jgi:hypothetical protein
VKLFTAILFSALLLLTPFASVQASASICRPAPKMACCHAGCPMACCQTSDSHPPAAPTLPAQKDGAQAQISAFTLSLALWSLPESASVGFSSSSESALKLAPMPLYTRHCALLL